MTGTSHETWRAGPGPSPAVMVTPPGTWPRRESSLLRFSRWRGGPGGHLEHVGTARLHRDGIVTVSRPALERVLSEPRLLVIDGQPTDRHLSIADGAEWFTNAAIVGRLYGRGIAPAYGDIMVERGGAS